MSDGGLFEFTGAYSGNPIAVVATSVEAVYVDGANTIIRLRTGKEVAVKQDYCTVTNVLGGWLGGDAFPPLRRRKDDK